MLKPNYIQTTLTALIAILLFPVMSTAQSVFFFSSKQGLSNSCIRNLYEDSRHNIWITTKNGLNRYDGVKMNVYRHDDNDSTSLLLDESTCVLEYDHNNVLIGTGMGVQMYSHATDKFTPITIRPVQGDYTISPRIVRFAKLSSGKIMVCMAGFGCGELCTDKNGNPYIQTTDKYSIGEHYEPPIQFFEDKDNNVWTIMSNMHLYRQLKNGKFKHYPEFTDAINACKSSSGNMYVATINHGLFRYDTKGDTFIQVATNAECGTMSNISKWIGDDLIICSDGGGLRIFNERTGKVKQSTLQINDFNLATSNVKDAMMDSFGNVWVAIYWKGVMMKPYNQSAFEYVGRHSITKNSLGTNSVVSMAATADNHILVGTDNSGLYILSEDGTSSIHINPDEHPGMPRSITAILPRKDGSALLASFFDGLYLYKDGAVTPLNRDIRFIFDIKPASNGNYWIASMGEYLYNYNPSTNSFVCYDSEHYKDLNINRYLHSVVQRGNKLFIASQGGMSIANLKANGEIKDNKEVISGCAMRQIAIIDNDIWAATDRGLYCFDTKTLKEKHFTTADGLPVNSLKSIISDNGKLWIGSDRGLICFDPKTCTCESFFDSDGLQDNEFESRAALSMNGHLYFGGVGGITYFNPAKLEKKKNEGVQLHIRIVDLFISSEAIHVGDKSGRYQVLTDNIDDSSEINLDYTDNYFTLQLTIDGIHNQHIVYEYSINGNDWIAEEQSNGRLMFSNLKPGNYTIKIRARGYNMISEERTLKVCIHAPWYASGWAKLIYFLIFMALCWLGYEFIRRQVKARKVISRHRQEKQINEARIQFFMNISHEIRTPMTLILAPLDKLLNSDKDPERQRNYKLMKQNSNRILRLINQMMDVRKIEQGKFQLDYHQVELVALLQNIFDVFTTNAQNRHITYEFNHDVQSLITYVDPENIDKVVMNLLSNAFKFTPDSGKITLSLTSVPDSTLFTIKVADDGCGIPDEDKKKVFDRFYSASHQNGYIGTGIGLNLTYLLVNLHRGTINVMDNPEGKGTMFVADIPIGDKSMVTYAPAETEDKPIEPETVTIEHEDVALPTEEFDKPLDSHNKQILLVEDDENIRQYVRTELSSNFIVNECSNGQEAWDNVIAHPEKVNLIISDIMMPVMDGMTLCQKVKSNFNTNHIPIILMTALGSDADRIAGITNGADAYISKPFNIDVLQSTALNLLKTRRLLAGKFNGEKLQEEKIDKVEIESPDEHLMRRVMKCINANMDNQDLSVEIIADKVGISRVHFYRKMKDLTGQSPRDYLKYVRLKEAARLLKEKPDLDITSVSMAVGFKSLSAFSTSFKALFGKSPSEYTKEQ